MVQRNHLKANYLTLSCFSLKTSNMSLNWKINLLGGVSEFHCGGNYFKKEKKKERKAESGHRPAPVYVQYTLQPNARLLHPMVKVAPSPVARDATLSAQLTPCAPVCEWCQHNLNHTNIAATTCDRESKKHMENTQPKIAMSTSSLLFL